MITMTMTIMKMAIMRKRDFFSGVVYMNDESGSSSNSMIGNGFQSRAVLKFSVALMRTAGPCAASVWPMSETGTGAAIASIKPAYLLQDNNDLDQQSE